jgi:zinc and cadmium transporter
MPASLPASVIFGLAAALVTSLGLLAVAWRRDWSMRQSGLFVLAAAGMLISMTLLHIVPEALERSRNAAIFLLAGFIAGVSLNLATDRLMPERGLGQRSGAITPLIAIGLHSFFDGILYSIAFTTSFQSGVYAALPLILHEFAEGIIAFAILARHGFSLRECLLWAFLVAAATTPIGALMSAPIVGGLGNEAVAGLYALSAGLLLYVAAGPLLAPLREEKTGRAALALAAGLAFAFIIMSLPVHEHEHGAGRHDHPIDFRDPDRTHRH